MAEAAPLTHLETRVLGAVEDHINRHGQAPTIGELALALRLKSKGTVHRYVQSLIDKGKLERHGSGWRGLRVAGKPIPSNVTTLQIESNLSPESNKPSQSDSSSQSNWPPGSNIIDLVTLPAQRVSTGDFKLPLLGKIAAGQPIEAIEDQAHLDLAEFFIGPDRYALRVSGDSMMDVGILDGDTVILRKTNKARKGDIVVALIDSQEATLKRLGQYNKETVELIPENKTMQTMHYAPERVSFQGVLVGQLRSY